MMFIREVRKHAREMGFWYAFALVLVAWMYARALRGR